MRITDNFIYLFDPSEGQFPTLGRTGSASTNAISSSLCVYTQSSDVWGLHQTLKPLNDAPEEYAGRPQPYFGFSSFGVSDSEDWLIFADGGIWAQDIPTSNWFSFPLTSYNSLEGHSPTRMYQELGHTTTQYILHLSHQLTILALARTSLRQPILGSLCL